MSARATRPRSRRGRHAPTGELDPVAESSEEAEAASGSSELGPVPSQESSKPELPGSKAEEGGHSLRSRTDKEADGDFSKELSPALDGPHEPAEEVHHVPEAAAGEEEIAPPGPGAPDLFQTLQHVLSSLEAAAAAWRCQTVQELQDSLLRLESFPPPSHSQVGGLGSGSSSSGATGEPWISQIEWEGERERETSMRKGHTEWSPPARPNQGRGQIATEDPFSLSHPLLRRLQSDSSIPTLGLLPSQPLAPEMHIVEAQMEQLQGNIEKLKCFNRLLSAVLQGYKGRCEGLSMQLGLWESEATALRLALQYSEHCEEVYGVLLTLREADSRAEVPKSDLEAAEKEAQRLLAQEEAAMNGETLWDPQPSPEGSSVDGPTLQEVAIQLRGYVQRLQERRALVKILPEPGPTLAPMPMVPHAEALVQAILGTQLGPALPRLEKIQIQQDLEATRETLEDLMLRLQLVRREKRGLELQEAALRAQGPVHVLLLEQLRWEQAQLQTCGANSGGGDSSGGSSGDEEAWSQGPAIPGGSRGIDGGQVGKVQDPEELAQELSASLTRALGLWEQLQFLREELEQVAQKGRVRRAQSAKLNSDLCKAHRALVLAFRGAQRKQEEQRRKLEQQVTLMEARHAEELAMLEATTRVLGKPRPPRPSPQPGETFL
uniref:USH1 protein network component harmonin binding protein 1 n=1 Tax=Molossus molossus TaxID=27622 RepID=A0A7J8IDH5_MOLMO|nr:USH1 protein network component harmonin binding protein 1 [Molossus molossus]